MTQIPAATSSVTSSSANESQNDALRGLNMDHFLDLMITEMQNQDPLNPLENHQLMQQISQIREVGATERLTDTLEAVLLGQNVANATGLIGKNVKALNDSGTFVEGEVQRVTITEGDLKLHVGAEQVSLENVTEIQPSESG